MEPPLKKQKCKAADQPCGALMRCATDTMQIVLGFLSMADVSAVCRTCRGLNRLVIDKTACLGFTVDAPDFLFTPLQLVQSVFKQHIQCLSLYNANTADSLFVLSHMTQLVELNFFSLNIRDTQHMYLFPPKLKRLKIEIHISLALSLLAAHKELNKLLISIVKTIPQLEQLALNVYLNDIPEQLDHVDFLPLLRLQHLRVFDIGWFKAQAAQPFIPSLIEMVRTHMSLQSVSLFTHHDIDLDLELKTLRALGTPTPPANLTFLNLLHTTLDASKIDALRPMSTLQKINPSIIDMPTLDFMDYFRQCNDFSCYSNVLPLDAMVQGLQRLTRLTALSIGSNVIDGASMSAILPHLVHLTLLALDDCPLLADLQWAKQASPTQIKHLNIVRCKNIKLEEIVALTHLKTLQTLRIEQSFDQPMDNLSIALLTPPSMLLPQLTKFVTMGAAPP